jgi:putative flippase GtrA
LQNIKLYRLLVSLLSKYLVLRFLLVGGLTFLANFLFLYCFHGVLNLEVIFSQILAAEFTILVGFLLHNNWTYRNYQPKNVFIRFFEFNLTALGGSVVSIITVTLCVKVLGIHYLIGLCIGAILALFWNYFSNLHFIWKRNKTLQERQT